MQKKPTEEITEFPEQDTFNRDKMMFEETENEKNGICYENK